MSSTLKNQEKKYSIFITIFLTTIIVGSIYFWSILFPFFLGIILAFGMDPLVTMLTKMKIKRSYGILIITAFIICIILLLINLIPVIVVQLSKLVSSISSDISMNNPYIQKSLTFLKNHNINLDPNTILSSINTHFSTQLNALLTSFVGIISSSFKFIVDLLITLISFYYILKEKNLILHTLRLMIPPAHFDPVVFVIRKMVKQIHAFIHSIFVLSIVVFVFMFCLLYSFNSPFVTALAIFGGIASIIPYLGAIVQVTTIALVQLIQMYPMADIIWLIIIQIIFFTFMAFYLHPLITGRSVQIHPLVVIFCLALGGHIGGVFGMLIAIPIYILIKILFLFYFEKYNPKAYQHNES